MKTKITKSPEIADNVIVLDKDNSEDLSEHYLQDKIIVLDDFADVSPYQDSQIRNRNNAQVGTKIPVEQLIKKPQILFRNANHVSAPLKNLMDKSVEFIYNRFKGFNDDVIRMFYDGTLPQPIKDQICLRFNLIDKQEDMHFDTYKGPDALRMFVNLDSQPRVWRTSYNQNAALRKLSKKSPNDYFDRSDNLAKILNRQVLYDYKKNKNKTAYHEFEFAPGAMWICNSKKVSHQVVKGRRVFVLSRVLPIDQEAAHGFKFKL